MLSPKVSIILPNYNHAPFLQQRLDSILNQSFQDFELILLDDASSDDSLGILQSYAQHPKVSHFIVNEQNSGSPFIQWQKGLALAKGEYVWIAESDDIAEHTFLEKLIPLFNQDSNISVVISDYSLVDESGAYLKKRTNVEIKSKCSKRMIIEHFCTGNPIVNVSRSIIKTDYLCKISWTTVINYKYAGDWLIWCMILSDSCIEFHPEKLSHYRIHKNSTSNKAKKEGLFFTEGLEIYEWINKNIPIPIKDKIKIYIRWKKKINKYNLNLEIQTKTNNQLKIIFKPIAFYRIMNLLLSLKRFF